MGVKQSALPLVWQLRAGLILNVLNSLTVAYRTNYLPSSMLTTMVALATPAINALCNSRISDRLRTGRELPTNVSIIKVNSSKVQDPPLKPRSSPFDF